MHVAQIVLKTYHQNGDNMNKLIAILTTAGIIAIASPALAKEEKVHWNLAMTWPSTLTPIATPSYELAEKLSAMTNGNFIIDIKGGEEHKAPLGILDMVKDGEYEMGHSASYYWKGKAPATALFTSTPFGMNPTEQSAWVHYGGGLELMQKVYDQFNVYAFPGGNTGLQMGGWFRKEINSIDDLNGLKMRIPGLGGEVLAKLGVDVTNIAPGKLYAALKEGSIDALEWIGPSMDIKMGFHKIAPYYYAGWHEPAGETQFLINKTAYDKLSETYKSILKTAMEAVAADNYADSYDMNLIAWEQMQTDYPAIKVKTFPAAVLQAMKKATDEVLEGYSAANPLFKEIYESQKAYITEAREYTKISDYYYLETAEAAEYYYLEN